MIIRVGPISLKIEVWDDRGCICRLDQTNNGEWDWSVTAPSYQNRGHSKKRETARRNIRRAIARNIN